jgi:U4/U6.U5 tri-snRNP-associated protein 2
MASRKQTLPPSTNDSRTSDERPAKRVKVDDMSQASTSSLEPSNGMEDIEAAEDEESIEDEVDPGQSKNEPRASDLYLDTVSHSITDARCPLTRPSRSIEHSSTLTLRKCALYLCQISTYTVV